VFRQENPRIRELAELAPFDACSRRELQEIARLSDDVTCPEGTRLTREGAAGRECFVIAEGEAVVTIAGDEVARLGPGDIVGEMAVLDREPRSATVVATTPLRAVVMTNLQFAAIADLCPSVARRVMGTLAQRLRDVQAA
jgi:CRP-like cAMP-binding protein